MGVPRHHLLDAAGRRNGAGGQRLHHFVEVVDTVVQNARGDAVFEGGRPGGEVAAEARADQYEFLGVQLGQGEREVDGRGDHGLPVGPEVQALVADGAALAGAVEGEDVVAAPQRARGQRQ